MVIEAVHQTTGFETPSIIITGTTSVETLNDLQSEQLEILYKPLNSEEVHTKMIEVLNH